jgi:hypothetical protein
LDKVRTPSSELRTAHNKVPGKGVS